MTDTTPSPPVMQPRCVYCLAEQYALAVWDISYGRAGCAWCGRVPPVYRNEADYRAALAAARAERTQTNGRRVS
jgi:hypothetical protein